MILSYCDISTTPEFKAVVSDVTPELGDRAVREVFRDYMEYHGKLRSGTEIINKLSSAYFSPIPARLNQAINNEIDMTQTAKFKELGRSVPKKQLSNAEIIKLKQVISKANNELFKKGIDRVYKLENVTQVGQSDNYTWNVKAYKGNLGQVAKSERIRHTILDANFLPNPLQQASLDFVSYKNEPNEVDYKLKVIAALESDKVRQPSKNLQGFYNELKRQGVSDQQIELVKSIYKEGINKEDLITYLLAYISYTVEISTVMFRENIPNQLYHKLVVPGGINYIESEIRTPDITPSIKSHSFSSTENGIGWFRSDDYISSQGANKTRRVLETQSDIFQKGRNKKLLFDGEFGIEDSNNQNKFLQLLNKDNNWQTFFVRSIIQDSAKKNYNKVLFPAGGTALKVQDRETIEELREFNRKRLKVIDNILSHKDSISQYEESGKKYYNIFDTNGKILIPGFLYDNIEDVKGTINNLIAEKKTRELELAQDVFPAFESMKPIYKFYEETIFNVLKKQSFSPKRITDEYNNEWYEVEVKPEFKEQFIAYKNENNTVNNYSQEVVRKIADGLKLQVGVDFAFISTQDAVEITKNSVNPWKGQNAFFYQNKAYFIAGTIAPSDVLHEFVHPIIKSISNTNKPLFNGLYSKLQLTHEGKKIIETVSELYPDLDNTGDDFKEEVLVRSIEQMQNLNSKNIQPTSGFHKFIIDLLYTIKQLLRSVFGQKIKVQNLSPNTTLQELSDILEQGGKFELDPEIITDADLVAYKNEYNKVLKGFVAEKADKVAIEKLTNDYFEAVNKHLVNLRKQNNLGVLADILENKYKTGDLEQMKRNLKLYQTQILQDSKELEDEVELTRQRANAIINSLSTADNMVAHIYDGLLDLVKDIDNPDNVQTILYFQKFLNYWGDFANTANMILEQNGVRNIPFVNNLTGNVEKANRLINDFYLKASKEVLWDTLKSTADAIEEKGKQRIEDLQKKGAPKALIDKAIQDYESSKITPKMIEDALKGNLKDVSWAGAYMEGYGYSPDPVVGGLALYEKNQMTAMEVKVQQRFSDAAVQLKPLLDKVNYNPNKPAELGEKLGQKELVGKINQETGELEENEIWRFQNQFIGADIARDRYLFKVKQAGLKYAETHTQEDKQKLADIQAEWADHKRKFWNDKYTEPFYKAYDILKKDDIGNEARLLINGLYDELNELSVELERASTLNVLEISDAVESKRREIRQISSLYDVAGNPKVGRELEIAQRLQEFNEAIKDIYESVEIPEAFQAAYQSYEQKLQDENKKPGTFEYEDLLNKWKLRNVRAGIKEEFWTKMDAISQAIKGILSAVPQQEAITAEIDENYRIIKDLVKGNRDESGQPLGSELSPEKQEKVRLAQERIDAARAELDKLSGLSKAEQNELNIIMARLTEFQKLTNQETIRLSQLLDKQGRLRLNKVQRAELRSLFNELDELRSKEPTDSYLDSVNDLLSNMNTEALFDVLGTLALTKETVNKLSNAQIVDKLFTLSPEFEEWFKRNHILKEGINYQTNEEQDRWERTYVWNVIKPRDEKYYSQTAIKNLAGEDIKIQGLPSLKYYKRLVKDEYFTKKIIGETVDNRGYWLPKTIEQGAADDRYENKEYLRLKQTDPNLYNLLEKMKEIHLQNQEGAENRAKLWLDMPRYRKQLVERLQAPNLVDRLVEKAKTFWTKAKDSYETGFNYNDNLNLVKLDLLDSESTGLPIQGLSNLPLAETSTDIVYTTMRYMLAIEKNKALAKSAPVARAIQRVVNDKKNFPLEEKIMGNSVVTFLKGKKNRYVRQKSVNNFIERTYEGIQNVGFGSDSALAQNFSNFLFQRASTTFLAFNVPSALKNSISMKLQGTIEAAAGRDMSIPSFLQAEGWATTTTMKYSTEIYKQGPKSLDIQISELFDSERGKFQQSFGQSFTRTPGKDTLKVMERLTDFRNWVQLQASLQTLGGLMIHQKIPTKDGGSINYLDAWELRDNKIHIKDKVDPSYGVSYDEEGNLILGEKFIALRNKYQRIIDNLNGAMGKEDRAEADRYLLFRYISFFRRFLTSMITNRFSYSGNILDGTSRGRFDYNLGGTKEGWYITFLKLLTTTVKTMGRNLPYMSSEEKAASLRLFTEVGTIAILRGLIAPFIFGFMGDDEDRFKKLRAKSGALPFFGVKEDPTRPFDLGGWISNHMLLQTLEIAGENDIFLPIPGYGINDLKEMLDVKSIVFGPTIKTGLDVMMDLGYLATGDDKAYYQRDVGPYSYQQEGSAKIFAHIAKAYGFNGATIDPANAIKSYQSIQNR